MAEKPKKNQSGTGKRGGPQPNSGRKPKAVTEIKNRLIAELAGTGDVPAGAKNDAAAYAFRLFDSTMRDETLGVTVRLECASEILNRVWGKPKQAVEMSGPGGGAIPLAVEFEAAIAKVYREGAAT